MPNPFLPQISRTGLRRFARGEAGAVTLAFSLLMIPLLLVMGLGLDYGRAVSAKTRLQASLDGAVLAAIGQPAAKRDVAARNAFAANWPDSAAVQSLAFQANADGTLSGQASASVSTLFAKLVGTPALPVQVTAKAGLATTTVAGPAGKVCLLVLDPSSSQTLLVNSGATVNAPSCEIDVSTQGSPAAIFNSRVSLTVSGICVRGTSTVQNGGAVTGLKTGCTTAANPFANALPAVSAGACTVSNQNYQGTQALSPGVYCGNFNFNGSGTLNLAPGLYVLKNTRWNLNSGWTVQGTGVTFYFADSNSYIQVNSSVALTLSAPTSGPYADILIYEPDGLSTSSFALNGSAEHKLTGLVYLPSRNVTFNSASRITSTALTLVVHQVIWDQINWTLAPGAKSIASVSGGGGTATTTTKRFIAN
jgi:Flp pilus assembly protein TadG